MLPQTSAVWQGQQPFTTPHSDESPHPTEAHLFHDGVTEDVVSMATTCDESIDVLCRVEAWLETIPASSLFHELSPSDSNLATSPPPTPSSLTDGVSGCSSPSLSSAKTANFDDFDAKSQATYHYSANWAVCEIPSSSMQYYHGNQEPVAMDTSTHLDKLMQNPLFRDLQNALAQECSVVTSQPQDMEQTMGPDHHGCLVTQITSKNNIQLKETVAAKHIALKQELHSLHDNEHIRELERFYQSEISRMEQDRFKAISVTIGNNDSKQSINMYYHMERLALIGQIRSNFEIIKSMSRLSCSIQGLCDSPTYCSEITDHSPDAMEQQGQVTEGHSGKQQKGNKKRRQKNKENENKSSRNLNRHAVILLNEWFMNHLDNPYPSDLEKAELASRGGLTKKQVRYWFAHKRSRSKKRGAPLVENSHIDTTMYHFMPVSSQMVISQS